MVRWAQNGFSRCTDVSWGTGLALTLLSQQVSGSIFALKWLRCACWAVVCNWTDSSHRRGRWSWGGWVHTAVRTSIALSFCYSSAGTVVTGWTSLANTILCSVLILASKAGYIRCASCGTGCASWASATRTSSSSVNIDVGPRTVIASSANETLSADIGSIELAS